MNVRLLALPLALAATLAACGKRTPQADTSAVAQPPDTVKAATAAPDTVKRAPAPQATKKSAAVATKATQAAKAPGAIIGRDSVIRPGPQGLPTLPSVADTAKKRPPGL